MKKLLLLPLMLLLLTFPVKAAPCVALTFDDGPSGDNTEALIAMLEEKEVSATFFLCGYRMEAYPELPAKLADHGHELGIHGYSHTCFDALSEQELAQELNRVKSQIFALSGQRSALLRPPCGVCTDSVQALCRECGLSVILWSVDPEDWSCRDSGEIARRVCTNVQDGSIILLHDLYPSSVEAAGNIIDTLKAQGYEFVTVSGLARLRCTQLEPGAVTRQFPRKIQEEQAQ